MSERSEASTQPEAPERIGFWPMMGFQLAIAVLGLGLGLGMGLWQRTPVLADDATLYSANWWGRGWIWALSGGLLVSVLLLGGVWLLRRSRLVWLRRIEELLEQSLVPSLRRFRGWQLMALAAAAGIGEELCFRWALQGIVEAGLLRWLAGWQLAGGPEIWAYGVALGLVSVLFGLLHAITPGYFVIAAAMGLIFGLLVPVGLGLVGVMIAHAVYDYLAFLWLCGRWPFPAAGAGG